MRVLVILIVLVASSVVYADDENERLQRGKAMYDLGLRHYNLAEYEQAANAWKESYRISKRPLLLFNIGQAYRLAGDCKSAMTFYDNYQREEGNPRPELEQAIAECKQQPQDGAAPPAPRPPEQAPPPIEYGPIPKLVGAPPRRGLQIAGLVTAGLGVAAGGAAAYFAYDSNQQAERLDDFEGTWTAEQKAIERRGRRDVVLAYSLGGAGATCVIAGAVMLWLGRDQRELQVEIAPIRGGGAAASVTLAF